MTVEEIVTRQQEALEIATKILYEIAKDTNTPLAISYKILNGLKEIDVASPMPTTQEI
jgi:hypothetical protein